ncbi:GGDEF domain-containing protein [Streptodolium elevatio]|uniref:GGDEF domain-containing protein n=1 Tax=Streptodolium elevatio TaxID=3157996 RepID=A0ABV3DTD6_9ACTN
MTARTPLLRGHPRPAWLVAAAVPLAALAVADNWRVRRRLEEAARDELTGLPRRQVLVRHGEQLLARRADDVLVVLVDLDGFKEINDDFGHAAGDQVLAAVAARLWDWSAEHGGMAARLGGDEFAAVAHVPRGNVECDLDLLQIRLMRPVRHRDTALPVRASVGAAHTADLPSRPWSALLRAADMAMYRAKTARARSDWSVGPCVGSAADADAPTVNGRRPGRPGTHLAPALRTNTAAAAR